MSLWQSRRRPARPGSGAGSDPDLAFDDRWLDADARMRWIGPWLDKQPDHSMVDIDVEVDLPWVETRHYDYSKLYVSTDVVPKFTEASVVCFRLGVRAARQRIRLVLPSSCAAAGRVRLRLDPFPFCSEGRFRVHAARLVTSDDVDHDATGRAEMMALKEQVRAGVVESERTNATECRHLPESLSIELTARCNLTCGHCSSHGTSELHRRNNQIPSMDPEVLRRLADEVFPSLSGVTLVGRGEPLIADDATWEVLVDALRRYGVLMRFVTNGTLLKRRLTPAVLPLIDMVTVSIDGNSEETMRANRGGVRLEHVLDGVRHLHELRRAAGLARRPRLSLSWTLKRNNIHELPDFIERMAEFEPDNFYSRHLLVFFEKDRAESLIGDAALTNRYLAPTHAALHRLGIRSDCPPLMSEDTPPPSPLRGTPVRLITKRQAARPRDRCPFVHRTAVVNTNGNVPMCSVPFANHAGNIAHGTRFEDVWNGPVMTGVRAAMDTPSEWNACRSCWYREGHYASQRDAAAQQEEFDLDAAGRVTEEAWDFRRQRK